MATTTMRISRERKELLSKYATAAVSLYGVISVDEFVSVFNYYEDVYATSEEALLALKRLAKTDDVEYSIFGDIISGPEFQPGFDDYEENVSSIRASQQGKPRYLPEQEEFLKYVDVGYREPEKPYAELKAHILKHKLTSRGEGLDDVDGDLIDLHELIQLGVRLTEAIDYFTEQGYQFKGMDDFNAFVKLLTNAHNNTRMYDNNGFTPNEVFEMFERPKLNPLPREPFRFQVTPKVGRNAPCPCGSGLKYKKCCGK
jgi:hypothetical protein